MIELLVVIAWVVSPTLASQHQHQGSITMLTPQAGDVLADVVRVKVEYRVGVGCSVDEVAVYATEVAGHGSASPAFDTATESEDGRSGTREYKWDTCPLHSGEWLLTAEVLHRIPGTPPEEHVVARQQIPVRMDNLVIKSDDASTFRLAREYLVWNGKLSTATPEATTIPALTLHDAAPGWTTVWAKIYDPLTGYLVKTYTREIAMSGSDTVVPPIVWDGTWDVPWGGQLVSIVAPPGIYVYDVRAWQRCSNGIAEHDYYRRVSHDQHLAIVPPLEAQVTSYDPATEKGTVVVRFRLASQRTEASPPKIKVSLHDPDYPYGAAGSTTLGPLTGVLGENSVVFSNYLLRKAGSYPIVIQAWDEERAADKQHLSKPALERAPALYLPPPAVGLAADDPGLWPMMQNRFGQWVRARRSILDPWDSTPALGSKAFGNLSAVSFPHYVNERKPFSPILPLWNNRQNTQTSRAQDGLNAAAGKVSVEGTPWPSATERRTAVWFFIGHGASERVRSFFFPPPEVNFGVLFREEDMTTDLRVDQNLQPVPPVPRVYSVLVVPGVTSVPLWVREPAVLLQGDLSHLLCVLVAGCATAGEAGQTNIAKRFRELGARSSIGVERSEYIVNLNNFAANFWLFATKGYFDRKLNKWVIPTVYKASERAAGGPKGWKMYSTAEDRQNLYFYPPRYGFQKP